MAWIAGLVAGGISIYSAIKANKSGSPTDTRISQQQEMMAADQYGQYKSVYQPRETQLVNQVFDQSLSPAAEAARAGADARKSSDVTEAESLRNARRMGVNPSSPMYSSLTRDNQAQEAGLESAARTFGRKNAIQTNINNEARVLGMGSDLVNSTQRLQDSAARLQDQSDNLASARSAAAGQAMGQGVGKIVSGLFGAYKTPTPSSGGYNAGSYGSESTPAAMGSGLGFNMDPSFARLVTAQ